MKESPSPQQDDPIHEYLRQSRLLTIRQVAEILQIKESTAYQWAKEGLIGQRVNPPGKKTVRIYPSAVLRLIKNDLRQNGQDT